jgi:heat shock protein HslJ
VEEKMNNRNLLLLLILILALVACGGQEQTTPEPTEAPAEAAATEAPPTDMPPTEAPPTAEPAEAQPTQEAPAETESMVATMDHEVDPRLVNINWEWVRRDPNGNSSPEIVIENPQNYTLFFNEDGTFNATLDCNTGAGVYATTPPDNIFMELGPTTLAACPPESQADEMVNIFSGAVQNYRLEDSDQTLVLVWAAGGPLDYYRNAEAPVPGEAEVEAIPEDAIQLDLNGLATSYEWAVMPGNPIPQGPGGQGYPPHILLTFDGATPEEVATNLQLPRMIIFPTEAYVGMYQAAGNQVVADQVIRLGQLIATAGDRTDLPESPMPLLPPPNSFMDRWAQFQDLDFGVGEGVRYVSDSPNRQSIGVWTNETTGYYYQGLTTDQTFYVSLFWPVSTAALPNTAEDAPEEETAAATNPDTYPTYKQETIDTLNGLAPSDWSPDLTLLDGMAASLTFPLPGEETAEEETTEEGEESEAEATATPTLAAPTTDGASGTITATDGIFVRSGPGTEYPDIDVAAYESTVNIVGKSEDGQWWEIEVPAFLSETGTGWVSATWVDAVNVGGVPVVEAPDLETVEPSLTGVTWQWRSLTTPVETISVNDPTRYTILFNVDGSAAIQADCNNVGASYTADGSSISITLGPSTRAACPEDSLDQQFLTSLSAAAIYFFEGGELFIDMAADGGTMQFTAGDAAAPATPQATPQPDGTPVPEGPTSPVQDLLFNLVSYGPEGAEQSLIEGSQITATFSGGTVSGSAGCNNYTGTVTPVADYFTIGGLAVTQQACAEPAGVMEQEQAYLAALEATAGYQWQQDAVNGAVITGGRLFYSLADGTSGYLNFVAQ